MLAKNSDFASFAASAASLACFSFFFYLHAPREVTGHRRKASQLSDPVIHWVNTVLAQYFDPSLRKRQPSSSH
jgi:hypothetical protein